MKGRT